MAKLAQKTAVVTGGGSGIGRAIAERFAAEGARVIVVGRREAPLQETAASDEKISYVAGDITKTETIEAVIRAVEERFGGQLDILVNNAGWCPVQPITEMTIADYDRAFSLDVRALVEMTIHALPLIRRAKGNIINLSSVGATHRAPNLSMYVGAKAAVENFRRKRHIFLQSAGCCILLSASGTIPAGALCPVPYYNPLVSSRKVSRPFGVIMVCVPFQPVLSLKHSFNSKYPSFFLV